ncbi:hypothetical protein FNV60_28740 [Streptomyces sp. RLB3-5]|uniref:hypothetical protein n=1 Tax=unclassified Streptomyces TaxID=2593676 RepID=UPI001165A87D|nr:MULTISPECIES: hypothetical protein [unclassified Streptomyces]QDO51693.1 hypothetical protein FNV60_28740 [Streptomyces sp. RLB3-5]QDO61935.1 hypothetical protein FNV59_30985 [Streptomyces sp. RLB1-8]
MTESTFYSDRVGQGRPRVSEIITSEAWAGITVLIQQRIDDGSLARAFPRYDCPDDRGRNTITGTDEENFLHALKAHVPKLVEPPAPPHEEQDTGSDEIFFGGPSPRAQTQAPTGSPLDPDKVPDTATALDVVDFVALHVEQPSYSKPHSWCFEHTDYSFDAQQANLHFNGGLKPGQEQFQRDVDLLFARNGIAFAIGDDMCVRRLGPPEARSLVSDFRPDTGDPQLDVKLNDAMARFLSRNPLDRRDALEKLWDAFERLKTLELGGDKKKASAEQLLVRAVPGSELFRELLESEFRTLTSTGNNFTIRHHEHGKHDLPDGSAVDYLFVRLASLISLVLRNTGRMDT